MVSCLWEGLIPGVDSVLSDLETEIDLSSLNIPSTAKGVMDLNNGILRISGYAPTWWIEQAREETTSIPGIKTYDDSALEPGLDLADFNAPESVQIQLSDGRLLVRGEADQNWIESLFDRAIGQEQIDRIDIGQLNNTTLERFEQLVKRIDQREIFFDTASSFNLDEQAKMDEITEASRELIQLSRVLAKSVHFSVQGYSDSVGSFEDNRLLSIDRAEFIAQQLYLAGISPRILTISGITEPVETETSVEERRYNRRVRITLSIGLREGA